MWQVCGVGRQGHTSVPQEVGYPCQQDKALHKLWVKWVSYGDCVWQVCGVGRQGHTSVPQEVGYPCQQNKALNKLWVKWVLFG